MPQVNELSWSFLIFTFFIFLLLVQVVFSHLPNFKNFNFISQIKVYSFTFLF